jgi:hypothetical protein
MIDFTTTRMGHVLQHSWIKKPSIVKRCWPLLAGLVLASPGLPAGDQVVADETNRSQVEFFEARIRPVLVRECYGCHSQQAAAEGKLRGGLLLDSRQATRKGGDSGPAVVPGRADDSVLLSAMRHQDFEMPPKGKLSDAVISDFQKWIADGAVDPREGTAVQGAVNPVRTIDYDQARSHWSFRPLADVPVPDTRPVLSGQNAIDAFIRQRQSEIQVVSNPLADARTLIRRAWFDLLGVPPTPAEIKLWIARLTAGDSSGQVPIDLSEWNRLIDQLLASPQYGERWARHWMDVARFAESHGYEQDYDRPNAFHYRDFLIKAFNADMPYDQFVRWQLAGDELSPNDPLAWMATGFLAAGAFPTQLTEAEFESARYDELDDMVATSGVAFLGLSIGCARCHDHKFDPISSLDYYRFAATFTEVIRCEKELDLEPEANQAIREEYSRQLEAKRRQLSTIEADMPRRLAEWIADDKLETGPGNEWIVLEGQVASTADTIYEPQSDGSFLASGKAPGKETLTFSTTLPGKLHLTAIRLEALSDESFPNRGPGRARNGNFALGDFALFVDESESRSPKPIKFATAKATYQQNDSSLSVLASIDDDPVSGWAVDGQIGHDQAAVFTLEVPQDLSAGSRLKCVLTFQHPNGQHVIGRFRISATANPAAEARVDGEVLPPNVATSLQGWRSRVTDEMSPSELLSRLRAESDWGKTLDWFRTTQADYRQLRDEILAAEKAGPPLKFATVLVASEGLPHLSHHADGRGYPHFYPRVNFLRRGDVHQKGEAVSSAPLTVLVSKSATVERWQSGPPLGTSQRTSLRRARLAAWMTDPQAGAGGLAARVMVNRLWQHHFGRGIVRTPNDFGFAGEAPTHPALLDWLAGEFVRSGWSLKHVHRLMMNSHTYMQSSDWMPPDREQAASADSQLDPENLTYWRAQPRRMQAEALRDSLLSVAGLLDSRMYGPGTLDESMNRRSVYFFIKRSALIPSMMLFDWPEHLVSIGERSSTTIAPQALLLMNAAWVRESATAMADRLFDDSAQAKPVSAAQLIQRGYQLAYGREATQEEVQASVVFLRELAAEREDNVTESGHSSFEAGADLDVELPRICWADWCQVLLSSNEFIYID